MKLNNTQLEQLKKFDDAINETAQRATQELIVRRNSYLAGIWHTGKTPDKDFELVDGELKAK